MLCLCSSVLWKIGLESDKTGYLAEISKQRVEGAACFLLTADSKMQERNKLKKELLSNEQKETRT